VPIALIKQQGPSGFQIETFVETSESGFVETLRLTVPQAGEGMLVVDCTTERGEGSPDLDTATLDLAHPYTSPSEVWLSMRSTAEGGEVIVQPASGLPHTFLQAVNLSGGQEEVLPAGLEETLPAGLEEALKALADAVAFAAQQASEQYQRFHGNRTDDLKAFAKARDKFTRAEHTDRKSLPRDEALENLGKLERVVRYSDDSDSVREGNVKPLLSDLTPGSLGEYRAFVYEQLEQAGWDLASFEQAMQIPDGTGRDYLDWLQELDEQFRSFYRQALALSIALEGYQHLYLAGSIGYTLADALADLRSDSSERQLRAMELAGLPTRHKLAVVNRFYNNERVLPPGFEHAVRRLLELAEQDDDMEVKGRAYGAFVDFARTGII